MKRKSLLYKSKVEYGGWTINHIQGCAHGCAYPCYAMMLAKRTGRVRSYEDWCRPQLIDNAIQLLDAELPRLSNDIDSVHLSFTTDPFMYDTSKGTVVESVVQLTTKIIERLNSWGIRVTTLTKGVYPDIFIERAKSLSSLNQYGISVVSIKEDFRSQWEPGAAPIKARIESARKLSKAGGLTWVSIEPYPTPNIDPSSVDVKALLESVNFVGKVVFGRWNYSKLVSSYPDCVGHYQRAAEVVASWCNQYRKMLHIKQGTPMGDVYVADILGIEAKAGRSHLTYNKPTTIALP